MHYIWQLVARQYVLVYAGLEVRESLQAPAHGPVMGMGIDDADPLLVVLSGNAN